MTSTMTRNHEKIPSRLPTVKLSRRCNGMDFVYIPVAFQHRFDPCSTAPRMTEWLYTYHGKPYLIGLIRVHFDWFNLNSSLVKIEDKCTMEKI